MARSRYPSLQIPAAAAGDMRTFFEGVKERLEISTGDRGDPRDRLLTVRDIESAGMATVTVRNKFATLTGGVTAESVTTLLNESAGGSGTFANVTAAQLDSLTAATVVSAHDFILYNNDLARLQRVPYDVLRELFLSEGSDAEVDGSWQFRNEEIALELYAEAPRLRFTEIAQGGETLTTDGAVWDWVADAEAMSVLLVSDDDSTSVAMLEFGREGLAPSYVAVLNDAVLYLQDGVLAEPGLAWDEDPDTGLRRIDANRFGLIAGATLALDVQAAALGFPNGSAGAPSLYVQGSPTTGLFRAAADALGVSAAGGERLRVNMSGLVVSGTAVLTAMTGHLDVTPSAAVDFAALKVRDNAGAEIWRLNSQTDGDLDFERQSGTGLLRLNGVSLVDASLFTTGTLADARLSANVVLLNAVQTLTNKTIDTASNTITVDQADVTGLVAALANKLDLATYEALTPVWSDDHNWVDNAEVQFGTGMDFRLYHDGADSWLRNTTGRIILSGTLAGSVTLPVGLESAVDFVVFGSPSLFLRGNNTTAGPNVDLLYYRTSFSSPTLPQNTNILGQYRLRGYDTTAPRTAVTLAGVCSETWTAGSAYGADLRVQTIAIGATALATRMLVGATSTGGFVQIPDGTLALPGLSLLTDTDSGLRRVAANQLALVCGATDVIDLSTATVAITATTIRLNTTTATTVGAAGAAAALPAQPLGYISANIGGTAVKIPYYNT